MGHRLDLALALDEQRQLGRAERLLDVVLHEVAQLPKRHDLEGLLDLRADGPRQFVARWRLEGALKLPWRPKVKPYAGCTRYELDADGLICRHTESWSISAADAFGSTLLPDAVSQLLPGLGAPPAPSADALRAALAATPDDASDDACAACLPEAPPPESAVLS